MRWFIFSLFFFFSTSVFSLEFNTDLERKPLLLRKNFSLEKFNIVTLKDRSIWLIYPVAKRKQTWGEWWHNIKPEQPEETFIFNFSDWDTNSHLVVHKIFWDQFSEEKIKKYNQPKLTICTHLLENITTKKTAFARPLSTEDLLDLLSDILKEEHQKGYKIGKKKGESVGYSKGFAKGSLIENNASYSRGYRKGYRKGKNEGYSTGYSTGEKRGYSNAYNAAKRYSPPPSAPPLEE